MYVVSFASQTPLTQKVSRITTPVAIAYAPCTFGPWIASSQLHWPLIIASSPSPFMEDAWPGTRRRGYRGTGHSKLLESGKLDYG